MAFQIPTPSAGFNMAELNAKLATRAPQEEITAETQDTQAVSTPGSRSSIGSFIEVDPFQFAETTKMVADTISSRPARGLTKTGAKGSGYVAFEQLHTAKKGAVLVDKGKLKANEKKLLQLKVQVLKIQVLVVAATSVIHKMQRAFITAIEGRAGTFSEKAEQADFLAEHDERLEASFKRGLEWVKGKKVIAEFPENKELEIEFKSLIKEHFKGTAKILKSLNSNQSGVKGKTTRASIIDSTVALTTPLNSLIKLAEKTIRGHKTPMTLLSNSIEFDKKRLQTQ